MQLPESTTAPPADAPTSAAPPPRKLPAADGIGWWSESWRIFCAAPGTWLGIFVLFIVISVALVLVPVVGSLIHTVLTPVFAGGAMLGCHALARGEPLRVGHLFEGFQHGRLAPLCILGLIWLAVWLFVYRQPAQHPSVSKSELDYINSDRDEAVEQSVSWLSVLKYRETWAFIVGKLLTDPVWWFYLFWLPKWLNESRHIDIRNLGLPLIAIYTMASVGSVAGGWLSSHLMARYNKPNFARKISMGICAVCVVPIATLSHFQSLWYAVFAVGLAAAAHQGWSANLVTLVGDVFPRRLVGTVVGIGGVAGMVGSFFYSGVIGETLQRTGQYWALFAVGASAYLVALGIIHLLMPRMAPVKLRD